MAVYRLVCVYWVSVMKPSRHSHAVAIGTVDEHDFGQEATKTWSVERVVEALSDGHRFASGQTGSLRDIAVAERPCALCGSNTLQADPKNAFDGLPECLIK
jgi:hypothetical protein